MPTEDPFMRPEDVLPDDAHEVRIGGLTIRKGTVAAFLANAIRLQDAALTTDDRAALLQEIEASLPALRALGLFDVLAVRDPALRAFVEAQP